MSNKYFDSANNPNRALPYEVARAEQINNTDDLIEQGMALVEADVKRSLKLPEGTETDQVLSQTAAQRAYTLVSFNGEGDLSIVGEGVSSRQGKLVGWDADGNIKLWDYANDITAPVNAAAASASAAATSAANAATSANNAGVSAIVASDWAQKTTGEVVPGMGYSAKYWAQEAASVVTDGAILVSDWAQKTTGEVVAGQGYSAKYWAQEAASVVTDGAILVSDWAQKTTGEVVAGQGYSAKYWAEEAASIVTAGVIDDTATSTIKTWSSSKLNTAMQAQQAAIDTAIEDLNAQVNATLGAATALIYAGL